MTIEDRRLGLAELVARYAPAVHGRAREPHHVVSPLGAWLVLALAGLADDGSEPEAREELERVLGLPLAEAARAAVALLEHPHPAVAAAVGLWWDEKIAAPALDAFAHRFPQGATTDVLRDQRQLDTWARDHTLGMVERFPITLDPLVVLVLASALATRVRWADPFDVVPAAELTSPGGTFSAGITHALRSVRSHDVRLVRTRAVGVVGAHVAASGDGLAVVSVLPPPDADRAAGLAAAYEVATGLEGARLGGHVSLFDVPLGVSELGEVTEDMVVQSGGRDGAEAGVAVLPSWTARTEADLTPAAGTGFPAAGRLLLPLAGTDDVEARQVAVATYGREGFEAAVATGMAMRVSFTVPVEVRRRTLTLRFDRPYASVAVAVEPPARLEATVGQEARVYSRWFGVPVFGAWITEPSDSPA